MSTIAKGRGNSKGKSQNGTAGKPAKAGAKRRQVHRERCIATIPLSEVPELHSSGWRLYGDNGRIHMDARSTNSYHRPFDFMKNATSMRLYVVPDNWGPGMCHHYLEIRFVGDNNRIQAGISTHRRGADFCRVYLEANTPEERVWHKRTEWLAVALPGAISDKILEVFTSRSTAAADEVAALTAAVLADEAKDEDRKTSNAKAGASGGATTAEVAQAQLRTMMAGEMQVMPSDRLIELGRWFRMYHLRQADKYAGGKSPIITQQHRLDILLAVAADFRQMAVEVMGQILHGPEGSGDRRQLPGWLLGLCDGAQADGLAKGKLKGKKGKVA